MVFDKIKEILVNGFDAEEDEIVSETSLRRDLDMDELDFWDLVMDIEDVFAVEFADDIDWKELTVGNVVKFIEENI